MRGGGGGGGGIVKQNEYFIFIDTCSILQFVPARVHISSRVKLVGLAMGKENAAVHVTTTQSEHSTGHLGNFGQYFTEGKALAKPTSTENHLKTFVRCAYRATRHHFQAFCYEIWQSSNIVCDKACKKVYAVSHCQNRSQSRSK